MKKVNKKDTIVYDFTGANTVLHIYRKIASVKFMNTPDLTELDREILINQIIGMTIGTIGEVVNFLKSSTKELEKELESVDKKPNVFKRFWNFIAKKK